MMDEAQREYVEKIFFSLGKKTVPPYITTHGVLYRMAACI